MFNFGVFTYQLEATTNAAQWGLLGFFFWGYGWKETEANILYIVLARIWPCGSVLHPKRYGNYRNIYLCVYILVICICCIRFTLRINIWVFCLA